MRTYAGRQLTAGSIVELRALSSEDEASLGVLRTGMGAGVKGRKGPSGLHMRAYQCCTPVLHDSVAHAYIPIMCTMHKALSAGRSYESTPP